MHEAHTHSAFKAPYGGKVMNVLSYTQFVSLKCVKYCDLSIYERTVESIFCSSMNSQLLFYLEF